MTDMKEAALMKNQIKEELFKAIRILAQNRHRYHAMLTGNDIDFCPLTDQEAKHLPFDTEFLNIIKSLIELRKNISGAKP